MYMRRALRREVGLSLAPEIVTNVSRIAEE